MVATWAPVSLASWFSLNRKETLVTRLRPPGWPGDSFSSARFRRHRACDDLSVLASGVPWGSRMRASMTVAVEFGKGGKFQNAADSMATASSISATALPTVR